MMLWLYLRSPHFFCNSKSTRKGRSLTFLAILAAVWTIVFCVYYKSLLPMLFPPK